MDREHQQDLGMRGTELDHRFRVIASDLQSRAIPTSVRGIARGTRSIVRPLMIDGTNC